MGAAPTGDAAPDAPPGGARLEARVEGMHCAGCVSGIEKAVLRVPGVEAVSVSLVTGDLAVTLSPEEGNGGGGSARAGDAGTGVREEIARAVAGAGPYRLVGDAAPAADDARTEAADGRKVGRKTPAEDAAATGGSAVEATGERPGERPAPAAGSRFRPVAAALALAGLAMAVRMSAFGETPAGRLGQFALATPVAWFFGRPFLSALGLALRRGVFGMDSLIGLGAGTAYAASAAALFRPGAPLFFDTAALVVAFVTLGRYFEVRARGRASEALSSLLALTPRTACVVSGDEETEVPVERVPVGARLRVRPGERAPLDGEIVSGGASLDESALTGESVPVERAAPDPVRAGAMNLSGFFDLVVTRPAGESTLSRIAAAVRRAQEEKIPIQRAADRVAAVFVPVVMEIAAISVAAWLLAGADAAFAIARGVAVLVVACPCAIGLAAPIAVLVATGQSARRGILFRNGAALEALSGVRAVALDKTGTLTTGEPVVARVEPAEGVPRDEFLRLLASAEQGSEHPLGRAVLAFAGAERVALTPLDRFEALPGRGISASLETGERVLVGSDRLAREHGALPAPAGAGDAAAEASSGRLRVVRLAESGEAELLGSVGFRDDLRAEARGAVRRLAADGLAVSLLSGDSPEAVAAAGRAAGIRETEGGLLPENKLTALDRLRAQHGAVAMVGDGINDAPALARAEVGIAFAGGAEVAREAAPVSLLRPDLRLVSAAVRLSRKGVRVIRQNLFWAFAYNTAAIPLAAGVFYPSTGALLSPEIAAAAMALSSLSVVGNALRLRRPIP